MEVGRAPAVKTVENQYGSDACQSHIALMLLLGAFTHVT
jgi:hypothetical protein